MKQIILLLEDDHDISTMMQLLLKDQKFEIIACERVSTFHDKLKHYTPDLIILDVMLPDGNGLEVCKQLKADEHTKLIPVLMMSANTVETESIASGASDFIAKPFIVKELLAKIDKLAA